MDIKKIRYIIIRRLLPVIGVLLIASGLSSCFTGVEGTKRIELSRSDRKAVRLSAEEMLMDTVKAVPLARWAPGRRFYVSDNRASMVLVPRGGYSTMSSDSLRGRTLTYAGVSTRPALDGGDVTVVSFADGDRLYDYVTSFTPAEAPRRLRSDAVPMLIDLDMVEQTAALLDGRKLWTRSPLWYDADGNRIKGMRYVPVTVTDVTPGNMIFPLSVAFTDAEGRPFHMLMNFGHAGRDSRSFDTLFSLSDLRLRYPSVDSEVWTLIQQGRLKNGMTKEECRLSVGPPSEVNAGRDWSQTLDVWQYADGKYLMFTDGLLSDFRM